METGKYRIRINFKRTALAKDMTHLQQIKALKKIFQESSLPVFISKKRGARGPKMSFGPAISMGYESETEYADLYFFELVKTADVKKAFSALSSFGMEFLSAKRVPLFFPSVESAVNALEYEVFFDCDGQFSQKEIDKALSEKNLFYEKVKGEKIKKTDAMPFIVKMEYLSGKSAVRMILKYENGVSVKPEKIFESAFGEKTRVKKIIRKKLYWSDSAGNFRVL